MHIYANVKKSGMFVPHVIAHRSRNRHKINPTGVVCAFWKLIKYCIHQTNTMTTITAMNIAECRLSGGHDIAHAHSILLMKQTSTLVSKCLQILMLTMAHSYYLDCHHCSLFLACWTLVNRVCISAWSLQLYRNTFYVQLCYTRSCVQYHFNFINYSVFPQYLLTEIPRNYSFS